MATSARRRSLRLRGDPAGGVPAQAQASLTLGLQAYVLVLGPFRLEEGEALSLVDAVLGCKLQHEAGGLEGQVAGDWIGDLEAVQNQLGLLLRHGEILQGVHGSSPC